ncbi:MAG: two pore domain potassium channel family protein [Chloroflexi bacterium]|nr:two pore domain potassium channel family protein [Chloroflexota bacterium]
MALKIYRRFVLAAVILIAILLIGTVGYWFIGGKQYSFVDTLYMTVITITTIGFGEIIDLSGNVAKVNALKLTFPTNFELLPITSNQLIQALMESAEAVCNIKPYCYLMLSLGREAATTSAAR